MCSNKLTRRIKIVLVLEKWGEVLEYCAKSELHPPSGLGMLTQALLSSP
jgi:hypothetical protein